METTPRVGVSIVNCQLHYCLPKKRDLGPRARDLAGKNYNAEPNMNTHICTTRPYHLEISLSRVPCQTPINAPRQLLYTKYAKAKALSIRIRLLMNKIKRLSLSLSLYIYIYIYILCVYNVSPRGRGGQRGPRVRVTRGIYVLAFTRERDSDIRLH